MRWLERLMALVPQEARAIFPSESLLDHIPGLIQEIGKFVADPSSENISANTIVLSKARELGQLRHAQQASLHQVLREYDLLGDVLEEFVLAEALSLVPEPSMSECVESWRHVGRAVRVLMQVTAGTFIANYTETVTEQAQRLDRFNRAISHELRNVLGTLHFGAALLKGEAGADETHRDRLAVTMARTTERALKIIRSFERLPRSGILADKPTEQTITLTELIDEVFRQLQEMADAKSVALEQHGSHVRVHLDTGTLELILINLVANGIKYADPEKPSRSVSVLVEERDDEIEIRVEDNGIGIPAESISQVFGRFVRVHQHLDSTLGIDGTGLGLSIVEECVAALGGGIRLESEEHVRTVFTLTVPKKLPLLSSPGDASAAVR
jgi:signal transduction histidine kinase